MAGGKNTFTPDIISLFQGEYLGDWWLSLKLSIYILLCGFITYIEFYLINLMFIK